MAPHPNLVRRGRRQACFGRELIQGHVPFRPPHLQVQIGDIVVNDEEVDERVGDVEGPPLVAGPVVPHDADAVAGWRGPEGVGGAGASELGGGSG